MLPSFNDCEQRYLRTTAQLIFNLSNSQVEFTGLNEVVVKHPDMSKKDMKRFAFLMRQIFGAFLVGKGYSGCIYVTSKQIDDGVEFRCWFLTAFEVAHPDSTTYTLFQANKSGDNDPTVSDRFICTGLLTL